MIAALVLGLAGPAAAQPTFGRPKPAKSKPADKAPAKPAEPKPDQPKSDQQPPQPDNPDAPSPMFEPRADQGQKFTPSPEEWLDTDPPRHEPAPDLTPGAAYAW